MIVCVSGSHFKPSRDRQSVIQNRSPDDTIENLRCWFYARSYYSSFSRTNGGFELTSSITLALQENWLTKWAITTKLKYVEHVKLHNYTKQ